MRRVLVELVETELMVLEAAQVVLHGVEQELLMQAQAETVL